MQKDKWRLLAILMIGIGLAGAAMVLVKGEYAMGTSDAVPWGMLIANYLFFAATSVGLTMMAGLWYVFKIPAFKSISKRALALAIISIVMGFIAIGLELGNPLNMIWIALSPNLMSGIWWMGFLYSVYLGLRFVTVYMMYKGEDKKVLAFSRLTLFAGMAAVTNLGAVFGNIHAQPYWQGAAIPIHMLLVAFLSGAALLAVVLYIADSREKYGNNQESLLPITGKIMATLIGFVALFTGWRMIANLYGGVYGKYEAAMLLINGPLMVNFWLMEIGIGLIIPFLLIMTGDKFAPKRVFQAGIATMIGVFFMHYNLVIAGQLIPMGVVPGTPLVQQYSYFPMWPEIAIFIGTIGGSIFLGLWAEAKLPLGHKGAETPNIGSNVAAGAK